MRSHRMRRQWKQGRTHEHKSANCILMVASAILLEITYQLHIFFKINYPWKISTTDTNLPSASRLPRENVKSNLIGLKKTCMDCKKRKRDPTLRPQHLIFACLLLITLIAENNRLDAMRNTSQMWWKTTNKGNMLGDRGQKGIW